MNIKKILTTDIDDLTISEIKELAESMIYFYRRMRITPENFSRLFSYICVKDENGKWHGLAYGNNYAVKFIHNGIYIAICDGVTPPFKNEYCIVSEYYDNKSCLGKSVIIPPYSGYEDVLNDRKVKQL